MANEHAKNDKQVKIVLNGTEDHEEKGDYTYDQIVEIAKRVIPDLIQGPNILYTITYRKAEGNKADGSLAEGDTVKIKEGTIFNVSPSDKS